jgi:hypothetical protein
MLFPNGKIPLPLPTLPGFTWQWRRPEGGNWTHADPDPGQNDRARPGYDVQRLEEGWATLLHAAPATTDPSSN